ncbi:MAG TPA: hypothetical protein VLH10_15435 [Yinghuangia sp.]|nr:hypothetical protein [Yinghuangia sp.]
MSTPTAGPPLKSMCPRSRRGGLYVGTVHSHGGTAPRRYLRFTDPYRDCRFAMRAIW